MSAVFLLELMLKGGEGMELNISFIILPKVKTTICGCRRGQQGFVTRDS
jgi:hypothetical protein